MNLLLNNPFYRRSGRFIPVGAAILMHFAGYLRAKS